MFTVCFLFKSMCMNYSSLKSQKIYIFGRYRFFGNSDQGFSEWNANDTGHIHKNISVVSYSQKMDENDVENCLNKIFSIYSFLRPCLSSARIWKYFPIIISKTSCCPWSHGLRPRNVSVSVAVSPATVRVPS